MTFTRGKTLRRSIAVLFLAAGWLVQVGGLHAQNKEYHLKLDLDPVLATPSLWEFTPDLIELKIEKGTFKENPYIRWAKNKERARIPHKSFTNITVDLSIFGGKVPVESAVIDFTNGKASSFTVTIGTPDGELAPVGLEASYAACLEALNRLLGAQPTTRPRLFGTKDQQRVQAQVWACAQGVACLDYGAKEKILRFSLAPYSTEVSSLVGIPLPSSAKGGDDLFCSLDSLLAPAVLWTLTPEKLDSIFTVKGFPTTPYFKWLTEGKDSARFAKHPYSNISVDLSLFNGQTPLDEAVIEFKNGKASQAALSLYNRGDSGSLGKAEFEMRYKTAGVSLTQWLGVKPVERRPTTQTAVKITGWLWTSPTMLALLEYNTEALVKPGAAEFLRLKLSPPAGKDTLLNIAAIGRSSASLKRSELPRFLKKESNGDVFVSSVPMVDQGDKGYCVVASTQRMFGYLHIPCDQHEIAALAGTDATQGTSSKAMEETLSKIVNRFKARFKPLILKLPKRPSPDRNARPDHFLKMISDHINQGVPLLWGLELGLHPEEPPLKMQGTGGHMRLIIGYNTANSEILFTDSWGQGHELKRMKLDDAIDSTFGVYLLEPRDFY